MLKLRHFHVSFTYKQTKFAWRLAKFNRRDVFTSCKNIAPSKCSSNMKVIEIDLKKSKHLDGTKQNLFFFDYIYLNFHLDVLQLRIFLGDVRLHITPIMRNITHSSAQTS